MSILVTNASPQKIDGSPLKTVSNAPVVAGKSIENVWPVTYEVGGRVERDVARAVGCRAAEEVE